MKVILLAAGRSKRVKPIEDKNFLRFCGKYLIQHQLEELHTAGFESFIVVVGKHNLERLTRFAKEFESERKKVEIAVVEQKDLDAGMAGAVLSAKSHLNKNEPILIVSTNDVVEAEAYRLIREASQNDYFESCIIGKRVAEYFPGGYLEVDSQWQIKSIVEKPWKGKEPSDLINLVLHLHKNPDTLFHYLEEAKSSRDDRYEVALDAMMKSGVRMQAIPYEGYWQAIKFPWHVFEVFKHYLAQTPAHIAPSAQIDERANIVGDVVIDEDVKVFAGATIVGPAYIGRGSVVATNALVRESVLGERCVVGYNTEVARSFLGDDVWTHSNYIGDSIIGDNVSFGAGCITGNLRFDEANIQITIGEEKVDSGITKLGLICGNNIRVGVNTSFMPGVKVGSNTFVGAGIAIEKDIPGDKYVRGRFTVEVLANRQIDGLPSREKHRTKL